VIDLDLTSLLTQISSLLPVSHACGVININPIDILVSTHLHATAPDELATRDAYFLVACLRHETQSTKECVRSDAEHRSARVSECR